MVAEVGGDPMGEECAEDGAGGRRRGENFAIELLDGEGARFLFALGLEVDAQDEGFCCLWPCLIGGGGCLDFPEDLYLGLWLILFPRLCQFFPFGIAWDG